MRYLSTLLLTLAFTLPLSAAWVPCKPSGACPPPTGIVTGLASPLLPLYDVPVRFKAEVKEGGSTFWLWTRVNPPPVCTAKQLADVQDQAFGCGAKAGDVLFRTRRVRNVP